MFLFSTQKLINFIVWEAQKYLGIDEIKYMFGKRENVNYKNSIHGQVNIVHLHRLYHSVIINILTHNRWLYD